MPTASVPPGIVKAKLPLPERAPVALKEDPLAVNVTFPVGADPPAGELATVTVTPSELLELMLDGEGETVTVSAALPTVLGQALTTLATLSEPRPVAKS